MTSRTVSAAALFLALTAVGCGGGIKTAPVTGDVTVDGNPVESGTVTFHSPTTDEAVAIGSIVEGKYSAEVPVGEAVVRLKGLRKVEVDEKKVKRGYKYTEEELNPEVFPAKYNTSTELKVTIKDGDNKCDFACVSDQPVKKKK